MTDKTPLEKIEEMYDMLKAMQAQINVIDSNLKLLNSKANGELFSNMQNLQPGILPKVSKQISQDLSAKPTIGVPIPSEEDQPVIKPTGTPRTTTIVQGKILNDDGRPIPGVSVKIISPANKKVIAETKTNNAGVWTKFLGPGKYIIKYVHDTRPTQFRMIDVIPGKEKMTVQ